MPFVAGVASWAEVEKEHRLASLPRQEEARFVGLTLPRRRRDFRTQPPNDVLESFPLGKRTPA